MHDPLADPRLDGWMLAKGLATRWEEFKDSLAAEEFLIHIGAVHNPSIREMFNSVEDLCDCPEMAEDRRRYLEHGYTWGGAYEDVGEAMTEGFADLRQAQATLRAIHNPEDPAETG